MKTYHIYMIELKLDNDEEPHFYIGKTHNITKRLMNHISRNKKSTKLITEIPNGVEARVVAICEIYKIVFNDCENQLYNCKEGEELDKLIDSITSKIENKFVHEKIHKKDTDIEKNKEIYRGGHYICMWKEQEEPYQLKNYEKYVKYLKCEDCVECEKHGECERYKTESVIDEKYPIKDCLYEKTNDPEKVKYKEEYKQEIKNYIEEKVKKQST